MKIVILEADSLGEDMVFTPFEALGEVVIYRTTTADEMEAKTLDADVIVANKVPICEETIGKAKNLKLVCLTATGFNNLDGDYLKKRGIAAYNVAGYSTNGVAQHTFALLFYVLEKLNYYDNYVKSGEYSRGSCFSHFAQNFFELDGKHILLTSPQDMLPEGLEYHTGNGTLCIIGEMDKDTYTLKEQFAQSVDYGIDFYAMQTLGTPDGRRIMIGWMQNWDTIAHRCNDSKWFAQMSLPRELSVKNGRLYQTPIKELDAMRKDRVEYNNVVINNDTISLDKIEGRTIDMELVIRPEDKENVYKKFALRFAQNERFHTELCFRPDESVLKIDRKFSGSERALVHQRRCLVNGDANELKLRVILDRFSAEVFINDGEQVMSVVIFTEQEAKGISFFAEGTAKIDVVKYDLV